MKIQVSVLIPLHNVAPFVERCLQTLFSGTMAADCEFLICDDCSSDGTVSVVKKCCSLYPTLSIRFFSNEQNLGVAATRNRLLSEACGEYFIFCDGDDWTEPTWVERMWQRISTLELDMVTCDAIVHHPNGESKLLLPIPTDVCECMMGLLNHSIGSYLWAKMFRTDFVKRHGIMFENGLNMQEDLLFMFRFLQYEPKYGGGM